ncbi:MAG: DNA-binding response regulator [Oscillatoriales cyanobacterium]|jgi:two-component system, NarL family, response regulator|nr:MAG: DNA-binding response regulator [Oscillatoriales cyanobacterium]
MPTTNPLKILLVEDDELFRLGLRVRLQQEPDLKIVAEADDGEAAIELVETHPIELVLLDIGLPGIGGIETCCQLKQRYPSLPILVLTSHSQPALITRLVAAGAQGYCVKGVAPEKLILALRSISAGASWWDAIATQTIQEQVGQTAMSIPEAPGKNHTLTQREQEVLALIAAGKSNPEIAQVLYITPGTVRVHVHAILHKLRVNDRTQAVVVALRNKLITQPSSNI